MRKYLFLVLLIMNVSLSAQEILVNSFQENSLYELTGSEIQKDASGTICALVNVYFDEKDVQFEGSHVLGTTTVGSSYQVYLAAGASKVVVKHENYLPISIVFNDYGVKRLQSNKAYEIKLICDKTPNALDKGLTSEELENKANAGDAEAQWHLGKSYYLGLNDYQDYEKAILWFTKSAEQGNIDAIYNLGLCYYFGQGVNQDYATAVEYFKKAANKGHAMAQFKYAYCLHLGFGPQGKNIKESIKWYESAVSQDIINAKNNVAVIYLFNDPTNFLNATSDVEEIGFPQYYSKGLKYLLECEQAGVSEAYLNLGNVYSYGIVVEKDEEKAFDYYMKAVENGLYEGYNSLGTCYFRGSGVKQDYKKAFQNFEIAAKKGSIKGCYNLALQYYYGNGVKKNFEKAAEYYQKAAEYNLAEAEVNLAFMYQNGIGVKKDLKKAHDLYLKGGQNGDPMGYANIGKMYHEGEYVKINIDKAIEYYTKAADMGNYIGLINLAVMYQTGNGVSLDAIKAIEYYERACKIDKTGSAEYNLGTLYYMGCGIIRKDYEKAYELFHKSADTGYAPAQYNLGVMYLNGEHVKKNDEIGIAYIKKAAKQKYQLAVDYMNRSRKTKMKSILNSVLNSVSIQ